MESNSEQFPQPNSRFVGFLLCHVHQLELIAEVGFTVSLVMLLGAFFGKDWPKGAALWPMIVGASVLFFLGRRIADPANRHNRDWMTVPRWIRIAMQTASKVVDWAILVLLLLTICDSTVWHFVHISKFDGIANSGGYHRFSRGVISGSVAVFYALEALFFRYGELKPGA